MFKNRNEAAIALAGKLQKYKNTDAIILAISKGGIEVAYQVGKELGLPVEIIFTRKMFHPHDKELAIGTVGIDDSYIVTGEGVPMSYIQNEANQIRDHLKELQKELIPNKVWINLMNKMVIIIDDGITSGTSILGIIHIIRKQSPEKIIVAAPVVSRQAIGNLAYSVDEVIFFQKDENSSSVSAYYEDFHSLSDKEIIQITKNS
jgi:putative phosphoribosyl transferase